MVNDFYLLLFAIIIFIFVLITAIYLLFGKQIETRNRLQMVRSYKAAPRKIQIPRYWSTGRPVQRES